MKNITIAGRVGKDAETRRTQNGDPVTSFTVAVDDGYGDKKSTLWFDCSLWGKRGDAVAKFIVKGTPVSVSGDLSKREYDGKTYLTINVSNVTLQGGNDKQSKPEQRQDRGTSYDRDDARTQGGNSRMMDDEIPFAAEFR
jgi:single-strand DNA-binding protein